MKPLLFRAAAVLFGLAFGVYAAEGLFRGFFLEHAVPRSAREFERTVAANWPRPVAEDKPAGTFRILGLADSFGLAGGADNYHYLVERRLREQGYAVEVVNLSVGAYDIANELELLQRFGRQFEPDLILHGFFVGNDLSVARHPVRSFRGVNVEVREGVGSWLPQRLVLPRWFVRWRRAAAETRRRTEEGAGERADTGFSRREFLRIERVRMSSCRIPKGDAPAWPGITALLDAIRAEAKQMGVPHVMVVHPDQFQVEPELAREVAVEYDLDLREYDLDLPLKFLRVYGESRQVPVIDLATPFRRATAAGASLYLPRDTHYSAAGNSLAADEIVRVLLPLFEKHAPGGPEADAAR